MLHMLVFPVLLGVIGWTRAEMPDPPATWILQIEGDADGLEVTGATPKPFPWRASRGQTSTHRITLIGANGVTIATVPIDLSDFCLEPSHRGQPPHIDGDRVTAHDVCLTVKVPARDDVVELRIVQLRAEQEPVVLGRIDRTALLQMIDGQEPAKRETGEVRR